MNKGRILKIKLPHLLCLVALLSGCSTLKFWEDDKVESGGEGEAALEIDAEPSELLAYEEQVKIRKLWRSSVGKDQDPQSASLQPALLGDHIFAAGPGGNVSSFTVSGGDRVWSTKLDETLLGGVGVGADLVVVGSMQGEVIALSANTGEHMWRTELTSEVIAPPAINENIIVVQSQDGKAHGLSLTGELLWRYSTELPVLSLRGTSAPSLTRNMAIVGFANGKVIALNATSGALLWEAKLFTGEGKSELERMVDVNTPIVVGDLVYVNSYQGKIGALSRGAGRELWAENSSSYRGLSYGGGRLYQASTDDKVYAYQATSGKQLWSNGEFLRRKLTAPSAIGDYAAVADREGYLHVLSAEDGQVVGRTKVDGDGVSVPMISVDNVLYVQDNGGDLTAYQID
jgi:outer membrane protein assembly factor BamB